MGDAARPWSGADTSESTSQLNDAVAAAKKDLDTTSAAAPPATAPTVASRPKRVASAKTPPSQRLEAAAPPPQIAQLVDEDEPALAAASPADESASQRASGATASPASVPLAVRRGVSPSFVRGRAAELQTSAQVIRGDLRDLKKHVRSTFAAGFAEMKELVSTRVLRLRPRFRKEHRRELRSQVNDLRQGTECLRTAVRESFSALSCDVGDLSQQLAAIANNQPEPAVVERLAIRRLHGAIDALICEGGVGTELDRSHHDARMAKIKAARELRNEIAARPTARITADSQAPATSAKPGAARDDTPSAGVDDLAMPHPTDVLPAMYGARTWKLHAPSLLEAVPYAVNALEALKNATHKNSKARDLLQLRIARQERDIEVLKSSKAAMERVLSGHVESLQGVLARVADGRVVRQRVPESSDPDVVQQLQAVSATVEQFIEHLAYVAERHAQAAKRGQTVDIPDPKMGLVPSAPPQPRASTTEETRARLFPDAEKSSRLQGQLAILRRKHVQLRFRVALQTWRFRRCAYALVQRHDRLSAQEATEAQNAAFDEAMADMVKTANENNPAGDPSLEGMGVISADVDAAAADAPARAASSAGDDEPLPPPPPPPKVLAADEAIRRLERASVLPSPGLDSLMEVVEAKVADENFRFERRAEAAQESWRARRAKDALERFRNSQHSGIAPEPSKVLLELGGGHEEKPTVFSALPPPSSSPRFQKPTQVSATKARLRPISQPGAPRANEPRVPEHAVSTPRKPGARGGGRGHPATAPVPAANHAGFSSRSAPDALRNVPISDALGAFLAEAHTRPQTHHHYARGPRLS